MKKLITTAFLLIALANVSYGQDAPDFEEIKRLAEQGSPIHQFALGTMYTNGIGVPENNAEAVRWYRLAAEQGEANAQYILGLEHLNENFLPKNASEAVRLFRLAAEQGDAFAQLRLGIMYYMGEGVPQNNLRAYVWYSVAAAQGNEDARDFRDGVADEILTPEQLARGQDMATRCFESDFQDCE